MTEDKVNLKGKNNKLECEACQKEEDSQLHLLQCIILKLNNYKLQMNYLKLFVGTVIEMKNYGILEKMFK